MIEAIIVEGVDLNVSEVALSTLYKEMVDASNNVYGSHIKIAAKYNNLMPFAWYDLSPTEKSEDAKTLKAHKAELYEAFRKAGHTNPSVPFKRICNYGRNLANGLAPSGKTTIDGIPVEQGEAESDGAAPAPRSAMLRNVEELTALWKFNDKQDALPAKVKRAQIKIVEALAELGLDVANIAK